jgi:hypothetical protein
LTYLRHGSRYRGQCPLPPPIQAGPGSTGMAHQGSVSSFYEGWPYKVALWGLLGRGQLVPHRPIPSQSPFPHELRHRMAALACAQAAMQQKQVWHLLGQRAGDRCDVVRRLAQLQQLATITPASKPPPTSLLPATPHCHGSEHVVHVMPPFPGAWACRGGLSANCGLHRSPLLPPLFHPDAACVKSRHQARCPAETPRRPEPPHRGSGRSDRTPAQLA